MAMPRFRLLLLAAWTTSLLTSCAQETPSAEQTRLVPEYDEAACKIPKTQGNAAISANANRDEIVVEPYFQKKYDRADLQAVFTASAVATARYVSEMIEGRLYRIARDFKPGIKVCPMFTELPEAPRELRFVWDFNLRKINVPNASLAGLYFEACYIGESCADRDLVRPTILIDEARDRWTLVHEMMHHNFNRERKRDPNVLGERALVERAKEAKKVIETNLDAYRSSKTRASLALVQEQSSWLMQKFFHEVFVRGAYEEIAVEGALVADFLRGDLKFVATDSAANALWYMDLSLDQALTVLNEPLSQTVDDEKKGLSMSMNELNDYIRAESTVKGWPELAAQATADKNSITQPHAAARTRITEARNRFKAMYPEYDRRPQGSSRLAQPSAAAQPHVETSHSDSHDHHVDESAGLQMFRAFQGR